MELIPDIPEEVLLQQSRTEYLTEKIIEQIADDAEGALLLSYEEPLEISTYDITGGSYQGRHSNLIIENMV